MEELLQANVFFFIASVGIILLTVLGLVALWYVIGILRLIKKITERVEAGSDGIASALSELRGYLVGGAFISQMAGLFLGNHTRRRRTPRRRERKETEE